MKLSILTPIEEIAISRFVQEVADIKEIENIYLFGSRARGEGNIESDVDLAVVVRDRKRLKEIRNTLMEISLKIEDDLDLSGELILNPVVIEKSLLKSDLGIGKSILKEGILLWSKKLRKRKEKAI